MYVQFNCRTSIRFQNLIFFVRYFDESNGSSFVFVNLIFTLNFVTFWPFCLVKLFLFKVRVLMVSI